MRTARKGSCRTCTSSKKTLMGKFLDEVDGIVDSTNDKINNAKAVCPELLENMAKIVNYNAATLVERAEKTLKNAPSMRCAPIRLANCKQGAAVGAANTANRTAVRYAIMRRDAAFASLRLAEGSEKEAWMKQAAKCAVGVKSAVAKAKAFDKLIATCPILFIDI